MENASKALIIAGAILLSILIIGLGMMVFNQAKDAMSGSGLDSEKAAAYNGKFEDYVGTSVRGSKVTGLCNSIREHNLTVDNSDKYPITLQLDAKAANKDVAATSDPKTINTIKVNINNGSTYTVTVETYNTSLGGLISAMKIVEN